MFAADSVSLWVRRNFLSWIACLASLAILLVLPRHVMAVGGESHKPGDITAARLATAITYYRCGNLEDRYNGCRSNL